MHVVPSRHHASAPSHRPSDTEVSHMRTRLGIGKGDEDGFSMIELFVIMIIIGILAAIAIPLLVRQRERAVHASLRSDLRNAATTMETYYLEKGQYAASALDLEAPFPTDKNTDLTIVATGNAADSYCLKATNPGSSSAIYYDSDKGGVQPLGQTCS